MEISIIVSVIIAMSEIAKNLGLNKKYIPLLNIILGSIGGIFYLNNDFKTNLMWGLVAGLTASGLFDLTKIIKK